MTDSTKTAEIIGSVGKVIEEQKEYLTELDRPIGDSDHGINMARVFAAVEKKLPTVAGKRYRDNLKTVGMTVSTVGGASGIFTGLYEGRRGGNRKDRNRHGGFS